MLKMLQTQRDGMEREVGGGVGMGNTCKSMLIHVNVWQKPLQYCKVISLQLIKIDGGKKTAPEGPHLSRVKINVITMISEGIKCI